MGTMWKKGKWRIKGLWEVQVFGVTPQKVTESHVKQPAVCVAVFLNVCPCVWLSCCPSAVCLSPATCLVFLQSRTSVCSLAVMFLCVFLSACVIIAIFVFCQKSAEKALVSIFFQPTACRFLFLRQQHCENKRHLATLGSLYLSGWSVIYNRQPFKLSLHF